MNFKEISCWLLNYVLPIFRSPIKTHLTTLLLLTFSACIELISVDVIRIYSWIWLILSSTLAVAPMPQDCVALTAPATDCCWWCCCCGCVFSISPLRCNPMAAVSFTVPIESGVRFTPCRWRLLKWCCSCCWSLYCWWKTDELGVVGITTPSEFFVIYLTFC